MPSPFPGMDPYLENPALWRGVQRRLAVYAGDVLSAALGERYFVDLAERSYVLEEHDAAVLLRIEEAVEVREPRLVVEDVEAREVVAVVEVLSPTNKVLGSAGREAYLEKRREVLRSPSHLVEIDLLRAGARFPSLEPLPSGDYHVHVSLPLGVRAAKCMPGDPRPDPDRGAPSAEGRRGRAARCRRGAAPCLRAGALRAPARLRRPTAVSGARQRGRHMARRRSSRGWSEVSVSARLAKPRPRRS